MPCVWTAWCVTPMSCFRRCCRPGCLRRNCGLSKAAVCPESETDEGGDAGPITNHIWSIEVEDYWLAVARLSFTFRGGATAQLQVASPEYLDRHQEGDCTKRTRLSKNEYWVGLQGHLDWQDGERVLMIERLKLVTYEKGVFLSAREVQPCSHDKGYPTGRATAVNWELPPGYAVRSLRGPKRFQGGMFVNGLVGILIPEAKPTIWSRLRVRSVQILGASHDLLSQTWMWFMDVGLWLIGFYVDVFLDLLSLQTFFSHHQFYFANINIAAILTADVTAYLSFVGFYTSLSSEEAVYLFNFRLGGSCGLCNKINLMFVALLAHIFQMHMALYIFLSITLSTKHPMCRLAKEAEGMIEAPITSLIQCYSLIYYDFDQKHWLYLSMLSGFGSIGMALAGYDKADTGMEGLPGKLKLEWRYVVIVWLRAFEAAFRITSLALFQELTRPWGGFVVFGIDIVMLAIMQFCSGSHSHGVVVFLKSLGVSVMFWRNPLLEVVDAGSVPCIWYYVYRWLQLMAMLVWVFARIGSADIFRILEDDGIVVIVFLLSAMGLFIGVPFVRLKWATYVFEELVELNDKGTLLTVKAEIGVAEVQGPGHTVANCLAGYFRQQCFAERLRHVHGVVIEGGNADGPYLLPALCRWGPPDVQVLHLKKCGLSGDAAVALFDSLSSMGLRRLNLEWNPAIGDAGAKAAANLLKHDTTLKSLNLDWAGITDEGAVPLFEALSINTSLEELSLNWIEGFDDATGKALLACLEQNETLQTVSLQYSGMSNNLQSKLGCNPRVS